MSFTGALDPVLLTPFRGIAPEADPLAAVFAVQRQELLLLKAVDADQVGSSRQAVLVRRSPALLHGPIHVV